MSFLAFGLMLLFALDSSLVLACRTRRSVSYMANCRSSNIADVKFDKCLLRLFIRFALVTRSKGRLVQTKDSDVASLVVYKVKSKLQRKNFTKYNEQTIRRRRSNISLLLSILSL